MIEMTFRFHVQLAVIFFVFHLSSVPIRLIIGEEKKEGE